MTMTLPVASLRITRDFRQAEKALDRAGYRISATTAKALLPANTQATIQERADD